MEHSESSNNSVIKAGLILAIALAVLFGFLYFNARQENSELNIDVTQKERTLLTTQSKLDSIGRELDAKIAEVSALGGQIEELEALKIQLDKDKRALINSRNVNISEYKNKIKNYESALLKKDEEIARLRSENTQLSTQNQTLTSEVNTLTTIKSDLETQKSALSDSVNNYSVRNRELSDKVTLAAALKATNININAINSRGRERDGGDYKARRIDRIKVSFKLIENPLTKKENKPIYMRLIDPTGNVISDMATGSGSFNFGGKETVYTAKQTIFYDNTGQIIDFIYSRGAPYESGKYAIELYSEDFRIGQTSFTVK